MPKYYFHVVGFRHHDFKDHLEELYAKAEGNTMTLCLEEENRLQENAVRVNLVNKFVGYVRRGCQCDVAADLVRNEPLSVIGDVIDIDSKYRLITLEVDSEIEVDTDRRECCDSLGNWCYDGDLIYQSDEEVTLKGMLKNLERCAVKQSPVNDKMIGYIDFIQENLWRDAGVESQYKLEKCIQLFTANRYLHEGYIDIAKRLAYIATEVNSPEKRQVQVEYLYKLAHEDRTKELIEELGEDKVNSIIGAFPKFLVKMFNCNPQEYVGKLWYLGCSYKKFRQLQTVMAMRIAMMNETKRLAIEIDNVLKGGEMTFDNLCRAIENCYHGSIKNLALIYCVLRSKDLLVNDRNIKQFIELLVCRNVLPWMTKKDINYIAHSISQYMRDRMDHNKLRRGFGGCYHDWDEDRKEKHFCKRIASFFS